MRIDCPHCGRIGRVPDGSKLPKRVLCPGCKQAFEPNPAAAEYRLTGPTIELEPPPDDGFASRPKSALRPVLRPESRAPAPIPVEARVIGVTPSAPMRICDFCGESIQPTAKKCRHCGELLDPALRSAEEAKRIALRASSGQPIVINNSVAASASATAIVSGVPRRSFFGRFARLVGVACLLFFVGLVIVGTAPEPRGPQAVFGSVLSMIGVVMLVFGVPLLLIGGLWRSMSG